VADDPVCDDDHLVHHAARVLATAPNIWGLGVATIAEGLALRDAGIGARMLCCTPLMRAELQAAFAANITPSLAHVDDITHWNSLGNHPWHLSIDTGMNRAGVSWRLARELRDIVAQHPPEGAFTHFAAGSIVDASRDEQEIRFRQALVDCDVKHANPNVLIHAESSLGLAARGPSPYDLARPGIALYGWPSHSDLHVESVFELKARVVDLRVLNAGDAVSYGGSWVAPHQTRIATLAIGYGDGYRRELSGKAQVVISGTRCRVVGTVTMDMIMVDVSDVPCEIGDTASLMGGTHSNALSLDEVAAFGGLSPYEMLVGLKLRLPRTFLDENS
ncbi:MAG: alanine racemase, partial [Gemmatimonadaceae bacterium]